MPCRGPRGDGALLAGRQVIELVAARGQCRDDHKKTDVALPMRLLLATLNTKEHFPALLPLSDRTSPNVTAGLGDLTQQGAIQDDHLVAVDEADD